MFTFSARSLERLKGVHPDLVRVVHGALAISKIDFMVVEGLRSLERQKELFAAARSRTLRSKHLTGHAVDLAPMIDLDGDGKSDVSWSRMHFYPISDAMHAAAHALKVKLTWGGDWQTFVDMPHWEIDPMLYPFPK
jgi:peptidoglycan L-alanyl-D-glutamate endopeptidase CwlK